MASDGVRSRILETAGEIFAERGYEAATVREICEAADVNLAAVNYYFGGKESLYVEVLQQADHRDLHNENLLDWPAGTPPTAKLRFAVGQALARMMAHKDDPWEARLMVREIMNPTPVGRRVLQDRFRRGFQQWQAILDELVPAEMPSHQRHQIGLSIMGQCALYRVLRNIIPLVIDEQELAEHYGVEELAEHITRVSLAALGLASPLGESTQEEPQGTADVGP